MESDIESSAVGDWSSVLIRLLPELTARVRTLEEKVTALSGASVGQTASVNDLCNSTGTPVQVRTPDGRTVGDVIRAAAEFASLPTGSIVAPDGHEPDWKTGDFWEPIGLGSKGMSADHPGGCVVLRIGHHSAERREVNLPTD